MKRVIEKENIRRWISILKKNKEKNGNIERLLQVVAWPRRKRVAINLMKINKLVNENDNIIVPGKVLGYGNVDKKFKVAALEYSSSALEKLKKAGCETIDIEEMLKNKNAKIIM